MRAPRLAVPRDVRWRGGDCRGSSRGSGDDRDRRKLGRSIGPPGRRGERTWATYDHRPRFGTNAFGLRNRIAVLSEAYSYLPFRDRVMVTRAFVLETLRAAVAAEVEIRKLCREADRRLTDRKEVVKFGFASRLEESWPDEILVGGVTGSGRDSPPTLPSSLWERPPGRDISRRHLLK